MKRKFFGILALALAALALVHEPAAAHGHTMVGDYELVIGFHNEPAYQGEPNGLDLFVTNSKTGEMVTGLEETLRAEIIFGAARRELKLEPQWGQDGAYTAYVLPTEDGDYTWHIFGKIEDTPVDISMTSSPDTFGAVEAKAEVSFPAAEATTMSLTQQVSDTARLTQVSLIVGGTGLVFGIVGLAVGAVGLRAARRKTM